MQQIFTGTWCLSHNGKGKNCQRYAGTLTVDGKNIVVHLVGVPSDLVYRHYESDEGSVAVIVGDVAEASTSKSHQVTLINSTIQRTGIPLGGDGLTSAVLKAKYMLWGHHILEQDTFTIDQVKIDLQYLGRWVNQKGTDVGKLSEWFDQEGNFVPKIAYAAPGPVPLFENDAVKIALKFTAQLAPATFTGDTRLTEYVNVHIEHKAPIKLFDALHHIRKMEQLFSFLVSCPTRSRQIFLLPTKAMDSANSDKASFCKLHDPFIDGADKKEREIFPRQMLLSYEKLATIERNIFEFWFSNYDRFELAVKQYFGLIYRPDAYIENQFLDSIMAFEILHRSLFPRHEIPSRKVKEKWDRLLTKLDKNSYSWLASKLNLGQKRTLLSRFEHLTETFPEICTDLFSDADLAFRQIVTTRNFMVHGECPEELASLVIETGGLRPVTRKMKLLLQALLLYAYLEDIDLVRRRLKEIQDYKLERDRNKRLTQKANAVG